MGKSSRKKAANNEKKEKHSSNNEPLPSGTGVIVFRSDLKGLRADVLSHDTETGLYDVHLRGAPVDKAYQSVKGTDLHVIESPPDYRGNEAHRGKLLEIAAAPNAPQYVLDRARAIQLSDEISYVLMSDPGELYPEFTFHVHVPLVREYYLSQGWNWPLPNTACVKAILSLKGYIDAGVVDTVSIENAFQIVNFESRLSESLNAAESGEIEIEAYLLFGAFVYGLFKIDGDDGDVDDLSLKVDALWSAYRFLTANKSPTLQARVQSAVDREFASKGSPECCHKHLLWCICCLYIQRCKDLRIRNPGHRPSRSPEFIDRLVECAKTAILARPDSPHSYFVGAYLLSDTQEMCRRSDNPPRYRLGCHYALRGLEVAEMVGDPFYLYQCHILVAYWKMTSAYTHPYTPREVREHVERAEEYKTQCLDYTVKFDLHRGAQTRKYVLASLKFFLKTNPTYDETDIVPGPITLAPFEENQNEYSHIPGTEEGGKLDLYNRRYSCANCNRAIGSLENKTCARCGKVSYCGRECQVAHWKNGHKKECVPKKKK